MRTVAAGGAGPDKPACPSRVTLLRNGSGLLPCVILGMAIAGWSQTSNAPDSDKSWTARTQSQDSSVGSQTRTVNSHTQSGNRTIDKQSTQILRSGSYQPYQDIERESVQVDSSTTRTTVRTYGRDSNGQRTLVQVTDEEKLDLPGGASKLVRSTSNPDPNGNLVVIQRQVEDKIKSGKNVEETKTTTFQPGVNGGLAPSMQVLERREQVDDHTVQFRKSTMLPDGAGHWQAGEVKTGTITDTGTDRSSEERVLRPDAAGNLGEVSRTVSKESQSPSGETHSVVENYATDVPGSSSNGSLRLVQRVTTRQQKSSGGQTTQQQVEQINPGDPGAGLQVTVQSSGSKAEGVTGTRDTQTLEVRGPDGRMNAVSVDLTKSDQTPPVQVQIAPRAKPK